MKPIQTWEYKVVEKQECSEKQLNKYGDDGWELVTVLTYWPADKHWIFKRETTTKDTL